MLGECASRGVVAWGTKFRVPYLQRLWPRQAIKKNIVHHPQLLKMIGVGECRSKAESRVGPHHLGAPSTFQR